MKYFLTFASLAVAAFAAAPGAEIDTRDTRDAHDAKLMSHARDNGLFAEKRCLNTGSICYATEQCCPCCSCVAGFGTGVCAHNKEVDAEVEKRCVGLGGLCYASEQCCNGYDCVLNSSGSGTCAYLSPPKSEEREVENREAEKAEEAVSKRCVGLGGLCYASEQCCNGYGCVLNSSGSGTCAYLSPPAETEKREAGKVEAEKRCVGLGGLCYAGEQCCLGYGCILNSSGSGTCAYLSPPVNKRCVGLGGLCYASEQCCDDYGCVLNSSGSGTCAYLSPPAQ